MNNTDKNKISRMNLLWVWQNQPPVIRLWFALSGLSIMAVYFVMLAKM